MQLPQNIIDRFGFNPEAKATFGSQEHRDKINTKLRARSFKLWSERLGTTDPEEIELGKIEWYKRKQKAKNRRKKKQREAKKAARPTVTNADAPKAKIMKAAERMGVPAKMLARLLVDEFLPEIEKNYSVTLTRK